MNRPVTASAVLPFAAILVLLTACSSSEGGRRSSISGAIEHERDLEAERRAAAALRIPAGVERRTARLASFLDRTETEVDASSQAALARAIAERTDNVASDGEAEGLLDTIDRMPPAIPARSEDLQAVVFEQLRPHAHPTSSDLSRDRQPDLDSIAQLEPPEDLMLRRAPTAMPSRLPEPAARQGTEELPDLRELDQRRDRVLANGRWKPSDRWNRGFDYRTSEETAGEVDSIELPPGSVEGELVEDMLDPRDLPELEGATIEREHAELTAADVVPTRPAEVPHAMRIDEEVSHRGEFRILAPTLASEIAGAGDYIALRGRSLRPGQAVYLYCELIGFEERALESRDGEQRYERSFSGSITLIDADGESIDSIAFLERRAGTTRSSSPEEIVNVWAYYELPRELENGPYELHLSMRDHLAKASARARIELSIDRDARPLEVAAPNASR